ncbi:alpha/beta fold hydrolase [Nonomuraea angiospora]|uniref:alpha/beta fold hydrolase n=1 Tax=Nonomuraea angiospora TaxID=46172 RepID=UPI0029BBCAA6|nr:alpha/beta fold hydrolase [Nonomuraea angiospora]MDX3102668.1 alpha/beta fold hydrolase [Nonomuraea angiospora]
MLEPLTHTVMGLPMASWRRRGPGPAVVCVHGAGVSSRELLPFVGVLGRTHDTWSVDLPGFGRSGKPDDLPTVAGLADALAAWLKAAELERPCVLGESFGCQVAVELAVRFRA